MFGGAKSPLPPLQHVAMISTNHDRLALAVPDTSAVLYGIRYRDGLRDKRSLAHSSLQLNQKDEMKTPMVA